MDAHHLDGRIQAVGVLALIGLVKGGLNLSKPCVGYGTGFDQNFGRMFLILITELAKTLHFHLCGCHTFLCKLGARQSFGFAKQRLDHRRCAWGQINQTGYEMITPQV